VNANGLTGGAAILCAAAHRAFVEKFFWTGLTGLMGVRLIVSIP